MVRWQFSSTKRDSGESVSPRLFGIFFSWFNCDYYVVLRSEQIFENDKFGCNAVSWAPFNPAQSQDGSGSLVRRLATGSCDNIVRVWKFVDDKRELEIVSASAQHTGELKNEDATIFVTFTYLADWVRDVAWAPNSALPYNIFASCSEDRNVKIWQQKEHGWDSTLLHSFEAPVWRLSWSVTGTVLAVSTGDHKVSLWKQSVDESWIEISNLTEAE